MYVHAYVCIYVHSTYVYTHLHTYTCIFVLVPAKLTSMLTFKAMLKDERMVDEEAALRYNVLTYVFVYICMIINFCCIVAT